MFSAITSLFLKYFGNNKLAAYLLGIIVFILLCSVFYVFAYNRGVVATENALKAEYATILEQTLKANGERLNREYQAKLEAEKRKQKTVEANASRKNKTAEYVAKNSDMKKECFNDEQLDFFNQGLGE